MNVIISNKNQMMLENLGIDVIKEMNGEFDADEIISTFQNFFFQRMILDITAIKNYTDIVKLDTDKIILLLDGTEKTSNPSFLSNLVSMGIYNFTKNVEGIQYLYNTPNTYRDVAKFHQLTVQNSQNQAPQPVQFITPVINSNSINEVTNNEFYGTRIIGVKNVTKQSGASSLVYMMKKELTKHYNVIAIEVDKTDFNYFRDKDLISTITGEVGSIINKYKDKDVILVDINNSLVAEGFCQEVLYLIEPSIIKLQKLMMLSAASIQGLKDKKVVLNQSLLTPSQVANFEYEARMKVFYNLAPLNEREKKLPELDKLLVKLGFNKLKSEI